MNGLNEEDKENLREMKENGTWDSVLKVCAIALANQQIRLLNAALKEGKDEIFEKKAMFEGAKAVKVMFDGLQDQIRGTKK